MPTTIVPFFVFYLCADGSSSSGDVGLPIEDGGSVLMGSTATSHCVTV